MLINFYFLLIIVVFLIVVSGDKLSNRPNIVFILVDDVGRNDFSIHGSNQIPTPNIDALGYNGVVLNRHYTMHMCTPSRAAFLTGKYPIRTGMQGLALYAGEPRSLPIHTTTLPEKLTELGYCNYLVGKWHLGHQNRTVTPLGRGFHHHYGYWNGMIGYFNHKINDLVRDGLDMYRDFTPAFNDTGKYATDLFTEESIRIIKSHNKTSPFFLFLSHLGGHAGSANNGTELGVPNEEEADKKFSYIEEPRRRLYAEIINTLDESLGKIVNALNEQDLMDNTILVFLSDNGAPTYGIYENFGSNWPLRGIKNSLFEGGVRNLGLIWSKHLKKKRYIENSVFHLVDWMPTLYAAAGGDPSSLKDMDGINHWPLLFQGIHSKQREDVLLNIEEVLKHEAILTSDGRFKLIKAALNVSLYNYHGDSGHSSNTPSYDIFQVLTSETNKAISSTEPEMPPLTPLKVTQIRNELEIKQLDGGPRTSLKCEVCLFDLINDPTETTDIADKEPEIVKKLLTSLEKYRSELVPQTNKPVDPDSDPKYCHGVWFTWLDPAHKCDWSNPA